MKNPLIEKTLGFIRELHDYASPFYYGASTNALGGVVFGLASPLFNPRILMPQTLPHILSRVLFGAGTGVAYSLGIFVFSLPYLERFTNSVDKRVKSEVAKDIIYSFLSIGISLFVLFGFAYFLFIIYSNRLPVDHDPLSYAEFYSSLLHTNWTEIALIPTSGILIKSLFRAINRLIRPHAKPNT